MSVGLKLNQFGLSAAFSFPDTRSLDPKTRFLAQSLARNYFLYFSVLLEDPGYFSCFVEVSQNPLFAF